MPNFRGRRFTNAHETMIWAARRPGLAPQVQLSGNEGTERRPPDAQRLADPAMHRSGAAAEPARPEIASDLQKPEALLHRVLVASTGLDDIALDPFAGTGTTAVVARRLGRHFIAIERHPAYVEAAWMRLRCPRRSSERRRCDVSRDKTRSAANTVRQLC